MSEYTDTLFYKITNGRLIRSNQEEPPLNLRLRISGGGFQLSYYRKVTEHIIRHSNLRFSEIVGSSAGAICGGVIACGQADPKSIIPMVDDYKNPKTGKTFKELMDDVLKNPHYETIDRGIKYLTSSFEPEYVFNPPESFYPYVSKILKITVMTPTGPRNFSRIRSFADLVTAIRASANINHITSSRWAVPLKFQQQQNIPQIDCFDAGVPSPCIEDGETYILSFPMEAEENPFKFFDPQPEHAEYIYNLGNNGWKDWLHFTDPKILPEWNRYKYNISLKNEPYEFKSAFLREIALFNYNFSNSCDCE